MPFPYSYRKGKSLFKKGDLGEYNQCAAQLEQLYESYKNAENIDEFNAYRILYMIHTLNRPDLVKTVASITNPGHSVKHALAVRSSLAMGDYCNFFRLYHEAPNMSGYLMDEFLFKERIRTLCKLLKAFRPTVPLNFIATSCGFIHPSKVVQAGTIKKVSSWLENTGIEINDNQIDCKESASAAYRALNELEAKGVDIKGQIH